MDEAEVRKHAEQHAQANQEGDFATAMQDLTEEVKASIGPIAKALPRPIEKAEVLDLKPDGERFLARIRYSGGETVATIDSLWEEQEGRPMIVELRLI